MRPRREDPLSTTTNPDTNNNGNLKCCNCETQLTADNQVSHIPCYLSSTPGELIKIRDAVMIVFEGDIRSMNKNAIPFKDNEEVVMCGECTPSFIDMYNSYTKFMGLTRSSSWMKSAFKESAVWNFLDEEEEEDEERIIRCNENDGQSVAVQFEKIKKEKHNSIITEEGNEKRSIFTVSDDEEEASILPDLTSSPPRKQARLDTPNTKPPIYSEKLPVLRIQKLNESVLQSAHNYAAYQNHVKQETDIVKVEVVGNNIITAEDGSVHIQIPNVIEKEEAKDKGDNPLTGIPKIVNVLSGGVSKCCPKCSRIFDEENLLVNHYKSTHDENAIAPNFSCQFCDAKFTYEWFFKYHIETVHDGIRLQFLCHNCPDVSFKTAEEFEQHKMVHHADGDIVNSQSVEHIDPPIII